MDALLMAGEKLVQGFQVVRDLYIFTDKLLILIDKQGLSGKKAEYHTIPNKSISHYSVEYAGTFDMDAEMKIYISGNINPIQREFRKGTDIKSIQKLLAEFILNRREFYSSTGLVNDYVSLSTQRLEP